MKVADAIKQMSKLPLQRIVDSFTKDFPKPDEDQARDIILRNAGELTNPARIATALQFDGSFSDQIRQTCTLEAFVNRPDWSASDQDIVDSLNRLEQDVLDAAASEDSLRYENMERVEILRDVLEAALNDDKITFRELNLFAYASRQPGAVRAGFPDRARAVGTLPSIWQRAAYTNRVSRRAHQAAAVRNHLPLQQGRWRALCDSR